jgi:hypothetical protein
MKPLAIPTLLALTLVATLTRAAAPTPPATAAQAPVPNWYIVEIIVFRATDPGAGGLETWPVDPGLPDWNSAAPMLPADPANPPVPYEMVPQSSEQLDDAWTRLKRSKNYEPLLHLTWTQPAVDRATAQAVRIGAPPTALPAAGTHATPASSPTPPPTPAYGDAKLSTTGPYLHFDLDLVLQGPPARNPAPAATTVAINTSMLAPPGATLSPAAPTFQFYRLRTDQRVNGGKLTYFDHPLFGAIVLVTPVRRTQTPITTP